MIPYTAMRLEWLSEGKKQSAAVYDVSIYSLTFRVSEKIKDITHQNFVNIPFGKLRDKLSYLCELNGIAFIKQEESYTSKASFWDRDKIPVYNADNPKSYAFSGKRVYRGM